MCSLALAFIIRTYVWIVKRLSRPVGKPDRVACDLGIDCRFQQVTELEKLYPFLVAGYPLKYIVGADSIF